jgi:hypothetical protein
MIFEECKKISICVTFHYNEDRFCYLKEICENFIGIAPEINLTIVTNVDDQLKLEKIKQLVGFDFLNLNFHLPKHLGHPFLLAWSHLNVFRDQIKDYSYTHFLYIEDDIKFTKLNVEYWLRSRRILRSVGLIPGFFRYEINRNGNLYSSDVMSKISLYDCKKIKLNEITYINITYPYQGLYFYDRELMLEHLNSSSSCPDFDHHDGGIFYLKSHSIRERAAFGLTFINIPIKYRSRIVLEIDQNNIINSNALVHHLPNNYTNQINQKAGKIEISKIFLKKSITLYFRNKIKLFFKNIFYKYIIKIK